MIEYNAYRDIVLTKLRHIRHLADELADATDEEINAILAITDITKDGVLHRPAPATHAAISAIETILRDGCNHIAYTAEAYQADNGDRPISTGIAYLSSTPSMVILQTPLASPKTGVHQSTPADLPAMSCIVRSHACLIPPGPITVYVTAIYPLDRVQHLPDPDNLKFKSALDALVSYIGIDDIGDSVSLVIRSTRSKTIEPGIYLLAVPADAPTMSLAEIQKELSCLSTEINTYTHTRRITPCKLQRTIRLAISGIRSHMGL